MTCYDRCEIGREIRAEIVQSIEIQRDGPGPGWRSDGLRTVPALTIRRETCGKALLLGSKRPPEALLCSSWRH